MAEVLSSGWRVYVGEEIVDVENDYLSGLEAVLDLIPSKVTGKSFLDKLGECICYPDLQKFKSDKETLSEFFYLLSTKAGVISHFAGKPNDADSLRTDLEIGQIYFHDAGFIGVNFIQKNPQPNFKSSPAIIVQLKDGDLKPVVIARDLYDDVQDYFLHDFISRPGPLASELGEYMDQRSTNF